MLYSEAQLGKIHDSNEPKLYQGTSMFEEKYMLLEWAGNWKAEHDKQQHQEEEAIAICWLTICRQKPWWKCCEKNKKTEVW